MSDKYTIKELEWEKSTDVDYQCYPFIEDDTVIYEILSYDDGNYRVYATHGIMRREGQLCSTLENAKIKGQEMFEGIMKQGLEEV